MRRFLIIGLIVLIPLGWWLYTGAMAVLEAERDLFTRLDTLVSYYVSMDDAYVQPLLDRPSLSPSEKVFLEEISADLASLSDAPDANTTVDRLLVAQSSMITFFASPVGDESIRTDPLFSEWSTNATNRGHASSLVKEYNEALSLYNARGETLAGRIASLWNTMERRSYLGIDGTTQETTQVTF